MRRGPITTVVILFVCILLFCPPVVLAQFPGQINLQGRLTDDLGTPVADNHDDMTFALYPTASGGGALWSELQSVSMTGGTPNSQGNLVVGYNEVRGSGDDRSGSHNIVVGSMNNFSSYGGLVAGHSNTISGSYASVSGGISNTASGNNASVSGGGYNKASGYLSSVSGGWDNRASGDISNITGALIEMPKG